MWKNINLERCLSYLRGSVVSANSVEGKVGIPGSPSSLRETGLNIPAEANPSITISRMCGAGGRTVASQLADFLQHRTLAQRQWTVFDKNLIEKVLEDHHLSRKLAEYVPEGHTSFFTKTMEKIHGSHPPAVTLVKQSAETIWNLAASGYVILVGRAANVITAKLDQMFHVRLVGSLETRIARVEEVYELGRTDAREFIKSQDTAKRLYMKDHFNQDIDDPLLYHMLINTDEISYEQTAQLIGNAVIIAARRRQAQAAAG